LWQHGGAKRLSLLHSITHLLNRLDPTNAISVRSLAHLERLNTMLNIFVEQFCKKKKKKKKKKNKKKKKTKKKKKKKKICLSVVLGHSRVILGSFSGYFTDCFSLFLCLCCSLKVKNPNGEESKSRPVFPP
jgi:hypothetical protein